MGRPLSQEEVEERIKNNYSQNVILISKYINRRSLITLQCLDCGYKWESNAQIALYPDTRCGKRQCPNCGNIASHEKVNNVTCAFCGKEIYRAPSRLTINKSGYFYCSRECGNLHKNQLREQSGEWLDSKSYRKKAFDVYPHVCKICGWDQDERILEVHHIDEDRENNTLNNLCILCPICHRKITLGYYTLTSDYRLVEN